MSMVAKKIRRLRGMGAGEVRYRLFEKARAETERLRFRAEGSGAANASLLPLAQLDHRFYVPASRPFRAQTVRFLERNFPEWIERAVLDADRLLSHRIPLLRLGEVELGPAIDWHRDPITDRNWGLRFWADYDFVHEEGAGDPKVIHELNRHQHLPRLAKAYFLTGDARYAREVMDQLETWIDQNPEPLGVNWSSSLELALRSMSWIWSLAFLLGGGVEPVALDRVGTSLLAQLDHIYRFPSLFSSPNTHLMGEAAALFLAGLVFEFHPRAALWKKTGAKLLASQMTTQVGSDGVHGELSTYYHCYAVDFCLHTLALAGRTGFEFPAPVAARVVRMLEFVMTVSDPDSGMPLIGDDDGGRFLALEQRDYRRFQDALSTGAVLFDRGDFKQQAGAFHEETFWLLGEQAWRCFDSLRATAPAHLCATHRDAGYAVQRSGWGPGASHLVFDCGGLGILQGGHAHADALAVSLFAGGRELLVDPGTCVYNHAGQWRAFFRSTRAHNTVTIDGCDQADAGGTFRWERKFAARLLRDDSLPYGDYLEASHSGYERLAEPVVHRRRVLFVRPDYWIVMDDFRGGGFHRFDFSWHFPEDAETSISRERVCGDLRTVVRVPGAALLLAMSATAPLSAEMVSGEENPPQGWRSLGYGHRCPAPALIATASAGPADLTVVTVLAPVAARPGGSANLPVVSRVPAESGTGIACAVECAGHRDLILVPALGSELTAEGIRASDDFRFARLEAEATRPDAPASLVCVESVES